MRKTIVTSMVAGTMIASMFSGMTMATAAEVPTAYVDFANIQSPVDNSMIGYILTPNYDIADSRMTLLGPVINRDTIPVQTFLAVHDGSMEQYDYESSVLQRSFEAYTRAKSNGLKWYGVLGFHPSWTVPWGGPWGGGPTNYAWYKQYIKDVLQYYKDRGAVLDYADLLNERWSGTDETYKVLWQALREVYPECIPAVGPGEVNYGMRPDMGIPEVSANKVTMEGPSWHDFWGSGYFASLSVLSGWNAEVKAYQELYPETNGKIRIWEENNSSSTDPSMWARDISNLMRSGLALSLKGCMQNYNWNGMSDLLQANKNQQNSGYRTPMWWVYYMFGQLSGDHVLISTYDDSTAFTGVACKDNDEAKVLIVNSFNSSDIKLKLDNQPFYGQDISLDLYKITDKENNGLEYQYSFDTESSENIELTIKNAEASGCYLLIMRKEGGVPSFFHPMTPDDGEAAIITPTLTWSAAQGAESYTVRISKNKDMSDAVIEKTGIVETSYTAEIPLDEGERYYWTVNAVSSGGTKTNNAVYSFFTAQDTTVPAQFGPYTPSMDAPNESVTPEFRWSKSYNADSYRVVISKNSDLSDPIINVDGITNIRDTDEFGEDTLGYYTPEKELEYDTKYYWAVYASNEKGERPMNGPIHYFRTKAEGDKPTAFELIAPANSANDISARAVLSWTESRNAFFYKLEISKNEDMTEPVIVRDRMIYNKYTVEPNVLLPNTKYFWRVTAYAKDLAYFTESASGIYSFTTEAVPCSPLLYAEQGMGNKVKLWFEPSVGATSYNVKYGTTSGEYTYNIKNITASPCEIDGLSEGTYYFAVEAENENGTSSVWNERKVELSSPAKPFVFSEDNALERDNGITARIKVSPVSGVPTHNGKETVMFELMKDNIPVSIKTVEMEIVCEEEFMAHFNVNADDATYSIRAYVLSSASADTNFIGECLSDKVILK